MDIHQTGSDEVNHPPHYSGGKQEAIDVIEDNPNDIIEKFADKKRKSISRINVRDIEEND